MTKFANMFRTVRKDSTDSKSYWNGQYWSPQPEVALLDTYERANAVAKDWMNQQVQQQRAGDVDGDEEFTYGTEIAGRMNAEGVIA